MKSLYFAKTKWTAKQWCCFFFYPSIFLFYFLFVFSLSFKPGFFSSVLLVPFFLLYLPFFFSEKKTLLDYLVFGWFFYSFISLFFTLFNGYPIKIGIKEFCYAVLPTIFYAFGKNKSTYAFPFASGFLLACSFCFFCGFFWQATKPDYYLNYLSFYIDNFSLSYWLKEPRMNSFVGSISVGMLSSLCLLLSTAILCYSKKWFFYFLSFFFLISSLASFQRSSYVMSALILVGSLFFFFKEKGLKKFLFADAIFSLFLMLFFWLVFPNYFFAITEKIKSFPLAFSERIDQWSIPFSTGLNVLWGNGIGTLSHSALGYTSNLVTDAAFINILGEEGIFGLALLLGVFALALTGFYHRGHREFVPLFIFCLFLIDSLGSNSFLYPTLAPVFWFSIGWMGKKEDNSITMFSYSGNFKRKGSLIGSADYDIKYWGGN